MVVQIRQWLKSTCHRYPIEMEHPPVTSTSTLQWMPRFSVFDPPRPREPIAVASQNIPTLRFPTSTPSTSTLSASATPISRPTPTLSPSHHQILDLQADIKEVLEHLVASHQEQEKISKDVDELATKVKVLERVLCADVGHPKKKRKYTDSDAVNRGRHGASAHLWYIMMRARHLLRFKEVYLFYRADQDV
ncbi:hypothetical protein M405DRAFT_877967 [Rhizopogon salebrosus TDB-379]|nr:hypothetical protein M405DRAFT_877967 [Rhizopogon salebrosus TDB-379]